MMRAKPLLISSLLAALCLEVPGLATVMAFLPLRHVHLAHGSIIGDKLQLVKSARNQL